MRFYLVMVAVNYLWNPLNDNIVREFDDTGAVVAEYTTEAEEFGNVVSQRRDAEDDYFHYDGVGSTLSVTNQAGNVTHTRAYTAFGETTEQSGTTEFPFQYVGRHGYYKDEEAGEYLVRRRTLSPVYHRWLSVDPLSFGRTGDLRTYLHKARVTTDPYTYAGNEPIGLADPSGLIFGVISVTHGCTCLSGIRATVTITCFGLTVYVRPCAFQTALAMPAVCNACCITCGGSALALKICLTLAVSAELAALKAANQLFEYWCSYCSVY
jgi:RHS repeat-associated protein